MRISPSNENEWTLESRKKSKPTMTDPEGYLKPSQIDLLLDACETPRDYLLLRTLAYSGRRVSEVIRSLKPNDINYEKGTITWNILKKRNEARTTLPIDKVTLDNLLYYIQKEQIQPDEYIFPISRQRADQIIKRLGEKIGLTTIGHDKKKIHLHLLRHSFAVRLSETAKHPLDIFKIQGLLAHSHVEQTFYYINKFNIEDERKLVEGMWDDKDKKQDDERTKRLMESEKS